MSRAELRRKAKEEKRKTVTYNVTKEQLDRMIHEGVEKAVQEKKEELAESMEYSEAISDAFMLCLVFPMEVLRRDYWQKSFVEKCPRFVEKVLELYEQFQSGEIDIEDLKNDLWEYGGVRFERAVQDEDETYTE